MMLGRLARLLGMAVALAGCGPEQGPAPDHAEDITDVRSLPIQLIRSFDRAALGETLGRLADADEIQALAAARAAGRWLVRKEPAHAQQAVEALAEAIPSEGRPAVLAAQVASMVNLLANREGLPGGPLDTSEALACLEAVAGREAKELALVRAMAGEFRNAVARPRTARLGPNVYDGPGWVEQPARAVPKPRRVAPYREPIHTVPVVAAGEVRLGDLTGDGAMDYLVVDTLGRTDGLCVRLAAYDHRDKMLWSDTLVGDDRPMTFPSGRLADINGDGRDEVVYADRLGRITVRNDLGQVVSRAGPFRTLDSAPYLNVDPRTGQGTILLAHLRSRSQADILLANGPNVLALTGQFQTLWHLCMSVYGRQDQVLSAIDLDGDGRDEVIRGNVCIGHDGRVLWTWPWPAVGAAAGRLAGHQACRAVLVSPGGQVGGFDRAGILWEVDGPANVRDMFVGRFLGPLGGRFVAFSQSARGLPTAYLLNGLGAFHRQTLQQEVDPKWPAIELHPAGLVCDWDNDGVDEVLARGLGDKPGVWGWFKWPFGPAVRKMSIDGPLVGLADVDNDGRDELLYFQGKSLVIHRKE